MQHPVVKLFPSFSGLLIHLRNSGEKFLDEENHYYFFQSTREGINKTFANYDSQNKLDREQIMSELEKAEKVGRLRWRHGGFWENTDTKERAEWLSPILGIPVEEMLDRYENRSSYGVLISPLSNFGSMRCLFDKYPHVQLIGVT